MELKDLDLLSEKVAKALYMIKNLKAENQNLKGEIQGFKDENENLKSQNNSLQQRLSTLEEDNAFYVEQVEDKENNIKEAALRLEGMLESLKALDSDETENTTVFEPSVSPVAEIENADDQVAFEDLGESYEEVFEATSDDSLDNYEEDDSEIVAEKKKEDEVTQENFLAYSEDDANPLLDFIVEKSESTDELPY